MTPLFSGYFDTTIGQKRDPAAYARIVSELGLAPEEILFLSDIKEELDAARETGMKTNWLVRGGEIDQHAGHLQVADFYGIDIAG